MEMHDLHDSWTLPSIPKEQTVIIFADSDTLIGLSVSQMPIAGSSKVVVFVLTSTMTITDKTDCMTPCACAQG